MEKDLSYEKMFNTLKKMNYYDTKYVMINYNFFFFYNSYNVN